MSDMRRGDVHVGQDESMTPPATAALIRAAYAVVVADREWLDCGEDGLQGRRAAARDIAVGELRELVETQMPDVVALQAELVEMEDQLHEAWSEAAGLRMEAEDAGR